MKTCNNLIQPFGLLTPVSCEKPEGHGDLHLHADDETECVLVWGWAEDLRPPQVTSHEISFHYVGQGDGTLLEKDPEYAQLIGEFVVSARGALRQHSRKHHVPPQETGCLQEAKNLIATVANDFDMDADDLQSVAEMIRQFRASKEGEDGP